MNFYSKKFQRQKEANKLKNLEVLENNEKAKILKVHSTQASFVLTIEVKFKESRKVILKVLEAKCKDVLDIKVTDFKNVLANSSKKEGEFTITTLEAKLFEL